MNGGTDHPDPLPGIRWVVPSLEDAARLADLYDEWAAATGQSWRETEEEIAHHMRSPGTSPDDFRCAEDASGRFVASIEANVRGADGWKHRAFLFTTSRPGFGRAEIEAIRWGERRARLIFAETEDDLERVVRVFSDVRDADRIARYESLGYEKVRYFVDMTRPLADPIPEIPLPDGISIVGWSEEWIRPAWETHCEAFADHWGSLPPSFEDWQHRVEAPNFRSDLSCVAAADGIAASYALNGVFPHDWAIRNRREGWIETLGTRRAWRRHGLASALIVESMRRFAGAGLDHAALGVDGANPTGAFGLYERLGFVPVDRHVDLMKAIPRT